MQIYYYHVCKTPDDDMRILKLHFCIPLLLQNEEGHRSITLLNELHTL